MVSIAIAGGTGDVAAEIVAYLVKQKKHKVTIFTRQDPSAIIILISGVNIIQVDYTNKEALTAHLHGIDTVLSFILESEPGSPATRNLIDACIAAGVLRFAANEWAARSESGMPWYASKDTIHAYLQHVNNAQPVLQYTLFQPGIFLNYFTFPHRSCEYLKLRELQIDFQNCRAVVLSDGGDKLGVTSVQDLAAVVAAAVDFEGVWPEIGGVRGELVTVAELIALGERIRGKKFEVTRLDVVDVEKGELKTEWTPSFTSLSCEALAKGLVKDGHKREAVARALLAGNLLATRRGAWAVPDEWNRLLPEFKMASVGEFLRVHWEEKS